MDRAPLRKSSPTAINSLMTIGERVIDFITTSCPRSMRLAIVTSPSRVSSGTVPISRKYMRTGSLVFSSEPGVRSRSLRRLPLRVHHPSTAASRSPRFRRNFHRARGLGRRLIFVNFDAIALKGRQQIVNFFRGMHFGRKRIVHFVIQQVAALFADGNELPYCLIFFFQTRCATNSSSNHRQRPQDSNSNLMAEKPIGQCDTHAQTH